jgi:hypothetical protein
MTQLLEQLAALTGLRDRDALDAGLVAAVADLTRARRVAVHRVVGDEGSQRWLTRAQRGKRLPCRTWCPCGPTAVTSRPWTSSRPGAIAC